MSRDLSSRMRPSLGAVAYADCSTTGKGKRSVLSRPVTLSAVRLLQPHTWTAAVLVDELDALEPRRFSALSRTVPMTIGFVSRKRGHRLTTRLSKSHTQSCAFSSMSSITAAELGSPLEITSVSSVPWRKAYEIEHRGLRRSRR
jgi:hypothetical protein